MDQERLIDQIKNPRNWGDMEDANGVFIGNRECGDLVMFFVKVEGERIKKASFLVRGCQSMVACGSMATLLVKGKSIWEAMQIKGSDIEQALGGLPASERHTADFTAAALYGAIQNYLMNGVAAVKDLRGTGWRSLYLQHNLNEQPENLYETRGKKNGRRHAL